MSDQILAGVTEVLRDVFDDPLLVVTRETTAKDVQGWDSMKQILIVLAVEERYAIQLTPREMDRLANVGDLVTAIGAHTNPS